MVKAYLRYEPAAAFGVIVSVDCNITYDSSGKHLLAAGLEKLGVWHVRQGICTKALTPSPTSMSRGPKLAVTAIAASQSSLVLLSICLLQCIDLLRYIWNHELEFICLLDATACSFL